MGITYYGSFIADTYNFKVLVKNIVLCEYNFHCFDKKIFLYNARLGEQGFICNFHSYHSFPFHRQIFFSKLSNLQ